MEERKTAAWILGILILGVIFFTSILSKIRSKTISFENCTVHFKYDVKGLEDDIYRASQNKLAHCLCNTYKQKPDTLMKNKIIKIYQLYGNSYEKDRLRLRNNIDSIIKYRSVVFDTLVLLD